MNDPVQEETRVVSIPVVPDVPVVPAVSISTRAEVGAGESKFLLMDLLFNLWSNMITPLDLSHKKVTLLFIHNIYS